MCFEKCKFHMIVGQRLQNIVKSRWCSRRRGSLVSFMRRISEVLQHTSGVSIASVSEPRTLP